jgi:hypothetical protein
MVMVNNDLSPTLKCHQLTTEEKIFIRLSGIDKERTYINIFFACKLNEDVLNYFFYLLTTIFFLFTFQAYIELNFVLMDRLIRWIEVGNCINWVNCLSTYTHTHTPIPSNNYISTVSSWVLLSKTEDFSFSLSRLYFDWLCRCWWRW